MAEQPALPLDLPTELGANTGPLLYLSTPLSFAEGEERDRILAWCHIIKGSVIDTTHASERPWDLAVHIPAVMSPPWRGTADTRESVYDRNLDLIACKTSAFVLLGCSGSLGGGEVFDWAAALGMPMLYLYRQHETETGHVSRQLAGTPAPDLRVVGFETPDELENAMRKFVVERRDAIEDFPRRRADRALRLIAVQQKLLSAWSALTHDERVEACAIARLDPRRIHGLISSPYVFALATQAEVLALESTLNVPIHETVRVDVIPTLTAKQEVALALAAREYDWDGAETIALLQAARNELQKTGVRRLRFEAPSDWVDFKRATFGD